MTNNAIIAVDPGKSGGFAWSFQDLVRLQPMPATQGEILQTIREYVREALCTPIGSSSTVAYMELVGGFIQGNPVPGSAMFAFGHGVGFIVGVLQTLGIRTIQVRPQKWQKHFSLGTKSECATTSVWKNKLLAEAQRRYPNQKITLKTADALLILDYAREQEKG